MTRPTSPLRQRRTSRTLAAAAGERLLRLGPPGCLRGAEMEFPAARIAIARHARSGQCSQHGKTDTNHYLT